MNDATNDDAALSPEEMLALVTRSQSDMARRQATLIPWILIGWGFAWLVGFLLLWLARGPGLIPLVVAGWTFGILMVIGLVISMVIGIRAGRGTRDTKEESRAGMIFGFTCMAAFIGVGAVGGALDRVGMSAAVADVYYPVMYGLVIGVCYLAAGAVWRTPYTAYIGGWLVLVSLVGAFVPAPGHYLVFAIAGGGAFLLAGILFAAWSWKRER